MISIAYMEIIDPSSGIYCIYMYIPELKKMSRPVVQAKKIFLWSNELLKLSCPVQASHALKK